jgi:signal transduction histidine kinase
MYSLKGSPFLHLLSQYGAEPFIINNLEELAHVTNKSLSFHVPYKTLLAISVRTGNRITGSLHIAYRQPQAFSKTELNAFSILSKAIGIEEERKKALIELKRKQQLLRKSEKTLKQFSAKVLSIREEEKKNISSVLHDEIGSMVVALSAHLTFTKDEIIENNLEQAVNNIVQTEASLKQSVGKLKSIALELRPPDLDIVGLSTALKNHFLSLSAQTKIAIDFTSTVKDRSIRESTAIVLYRVCQEALNNIVSHAKARTVAVQLTSKNGQINLAIQDDGSGFDTTKRVEFSRKSNKLGIIGMRERVESLGGTFNIEANMNKGTAIFVSVPHIKGAPHGNQSFFS